MAKKQVKKPAKKTVKKTVSKKGNSNHIHTLEIKNFKSIKHMKIEPKRINLFIGRPNVGKSNILEGISLLSGYYSNKIHHHNSQTEKYLSDIIRYEEFEDLFYDGHTGAVIEVISNVAYAAIKQQYNPGYYHYIIADSSDVRSFVDLEGNSQSIRDQVGEYETMLLNNQIDSTVTNSYQLIYQDGRIDTRDIPLVVNNPVKKFEFIKQTSFPNRYHFFLLPPNGNNLYTVVKHSKKLQKEIAAIFSEYKLDFVMKSKSPVFEIQKKIKNIVTSYPYSGIADTLQRYIFHLAAIQSNKDSVLLFEEPEAHSFPAYIRQLSEDIIADENENQFFITTQSPFILNIILENVKPEELNVYRTYYDRYETKVELLSDEVISEMLNYGSDIFFKV